VGLELPGACKTRSRLPYALAVGGGLLQPKGLITVIIGFGDGKFDLYSFSIDAGLFELQYSHAGNDGSNSSGFFVNDLAFAESYLAILRANHAGSQSLSLYRFDDHGHEGLLDQILTPPRLLSVMKANNVDCLVALSLRASSQGVVASAAYITTNIANHHLLAIQEMRLNASGDILGSRTTSTNPNEHFSPYSDFSAGSAEAPLLLAPPLVRRTPFLPHHVAISYSHPYLLVTSLDNTMTIFLIDSTPESLLVRPGRRLWGHTTGIARAVVSERGKAVSVANLGDEVRIWELEEMMSSSSSSRKYLKSDISTRVYPSRTDSEEREKIAGLSEAIERRGDGLGLALEGVSRWVGFDDEQLVVLKESNIGNQIVSCYDFR
jgi:hypothetical protein